MLRRQVDDHRPLTVDASLVADIESPKAVTTNEDQARVTSDQAALRMVERCNNLSSRASAAAEQAERAEAAADDQASRANDLEEARWIEEGAWRAAEARRIGEAR